MTDNPPVDFTKLVPAASFSGDNAHEEALVWEMIERARTYLRSFDWCGTILETYVGDIAVGGVVAVLLLHILPERDDVDEWLWVVVGDLPPAYVVTDDAPNPASALDAYIGEMERWVSAAKAGRPVDHLIPVEPAGGGDPLEPTPERALELEQRLRFLDERILSAYAQDLEVRA